MKFVPIFITLLLFSSCTENVQSIKEEKKNVWIESAEIYCYCVTEMYSANQSFRFPCSTTSAVRAKELVAPKHLLYSTNDKNIVDRLAFVLFNRKEKSDTLTRETDARIVILLKNNNQSADTLVFNGEFNLTFNNKYDFTYSFQIMDSIKSIISRDTISCQ